MSDGAKLCLRCVKTPFGAVGIVTTETHLTGFAFSATDGGQRCRRRIRSHLVCAQINTYLDNPLFRFDVPRDLRAPKAPDRCGGNAVDSTGANAYLRRTGRGDHSSARVGAACGKTIPLIVPVIASSRPMALGGFVDKARQPFFWRSNIVAHATKVLLL